MPDSRIPRAAAAHRASRRRALRFASAAALGSALTALVAPGPSLAAPVKSGHKKPARSGVKQAYTGKTAQGLAVKLSQAFSFGRSFTYQATLTCTDGSTFTDNPFLDDVRVKRGRFKSHFTSDRGATVTDVRGTIKGKRASGTIMIVERYSPTANTQGNLPLDPRGSVVCQSGLVKWSARHK